MELHHFSFSIQSQAFRQPIRFENTLKQFLCLDYRWFIHLDQKLHWILLNLGLQNI
jgi:hypothetical protein